MHLFYCSLASFLMVTYLCWKYFQHMGSEKQRTLNIEFQLIFCRHWPHNLISSNFFSRVFASFFKACVEWIFLFYFFPSENENKRNWKGGAKKIKGNKSTEEGEFFSRGFESYNFFFVFVRFCRNFIVQNHKRWR